MITKPSFMQGPKAELTLSVDRAKAITIAITIAEMIARRYVYNLTRDKVCNIEGCTSPFV